VLLDTTLIRTRRMELGLSQRAVARRLGVSPVVVKAIENGTNHRDMPLGLVAELAELLAVELATLLARPEPRESGPPPATLGALLATAGGPVTFDTLTGALGCTPAETRGHLATLDAQLTPSGLRVQQGDAGVRLIAADEPRDAEQLQHTLRGQHARQGLTALEAELLHRAFRGELAGAKLTNADQVACARLFNAGLVDEELGVIDDVRYCVGQT
jgi:transcriptional regulator with XRE-family HTH domain